MNMEVNPAPLTVDKVTGLCRPVTLEDVRRWERLEKVHEQLLKSLREAVSDAAP